MIHALVLTLMLAAPDTSGCATINVRSFVPAYESRSFPTLAVVSSPSAPVAPGYARVVYRWEPIRYDSTWSTGSGNNTRIQRKTLYTIPGGSQTIDQPINPLVTLYVFASGRTDKTERRACADCRGTGALPCSRCTGSGRIGTQLCVACSGDGKNRCMTCLGVGKLGGRLGYMSAYREREDWSCWIGSVASPAGRPDTMTLFLERGEVVCVRRTHPWKTP